jgi:ATP-dependent DNA ligase
VQEGVKSFIIDCEAVAWDVKEKKILPFQILTTRKRKVCSQPRDKQRYAGKPKSLI